jgi:hypothetical protein
MLFVPPAIAVTAVTFVAPAATAAAAATVNVNIVVVIIVIIAIVVVVVVVVIVIIVVVIAVFVIIALVVVVVVVVVIAIVVAAIVFIAAATAVVAIGAAAIAVAITTTTTARLCCSRRWLVIVLLSAVRFRHCTPSCNHRCSRRRPLSPPIVVHHCHRRRCRCCRAATATTATIMIKLTVIYCRRKRQQQQHPQRTNGSTNVKMFTSPDDLDLFNLSTVFDVCNVGKGNLAISKLLAKKNCTFFAIYILQDVSYGFGWWCAVPSSPAPITQAKKTNFFSFLEPAPSTLNGHLILVTRMG